MSKICKQLVVVAGENIEELGCISLYKEVLSGKREGFPKQTFEIPNVSIFVANNCIYYLVTKVLKKSVKEVNLTLDLLREYKLGEMVEKVFNNDLDLIKAYLRAIK